MRRAAILAAGKGTRLREVTGALPKPLLPLHGRPMLWHVLDRLRAAGLEEFLVVVGFGGEAIQRGLIGYPAEIQFATQSPVDGTGSAARLACGFAGDVPWLMSYADILAEPASIAAMVASFEEDVGAVASLAVVRCDDPWRGAAVYESGGIVTRVVEKPQKGTSTTPWNSAGMFAFRREIFDELERLPLSPRGEYEITSAIQALLATGRRIRMHELTGGWRDVGRPGDVAAALEITSEPPRE